MLSNSVDFLKELYPELKFWSQLCGGIWLVFKGLQWVKDIKVKDLAEIKTSVNDVKTGLSEIHTEMKEQTNSIVGELKELRADFRAYNPPRIAKAARKRKK